MSACCIIYYKKKRNELFVKYLWLKTSSSRNSNLWQIFDIYGCVSRMRNGVVRKKRKGRRKEGKRTYETTEEWALSFTSFLSWNSGFWLCKLVLRHLLLHLTNCCTYAAFPFIRWTVIFVSANFSRDALFLPSNYNF